MTLFLTDAYFHIGCAHLGTGKPCQDYALADTCDRAALLHVSDGCSSGRYTDVGARLVTHATLAALREHWSTTRTTLGDTIPQEIAVSQKMVLAGLQRTLGLVRDDMLATCMYAYVSPEGGFVHVLGDGVVAAESSDGEIRISRFEWNNNMPLYPAYADDRYAAFISAQGNDLNKPALTQYNTSYTKEGEQVGDETIEHTLGTGLRGITLPIDQSMLATLSTLALFSDGVAQVDGVSTDTVVRALLSFKTTVGEFAKRRMHRFIRESMKSGKGPVDDIAFSVLHVEAS